MDNSIKIILIVVVVFMLFDFSCSCKKVEKFTDPNMFNRNITYKMINCDTGSQCEIDPEDGFHKCMAQGVKRICLDNDEIDKTCENDTENSICNSSFYRELNYAPGPDENNAKKLCEDECNNNNDCKAYGIDIWEYENDKGYQCKHLYDKNLTNYDNNNKVKNFNDRAYKSITTEVYVSNENNSNYEKANSIALSFMQLVKNN